MASLNGTNETMTNVEVNDQNNTQDGVGPCPSDTCSEYQIFPVFLTSCIGGYGFWHLSWKPEIVLISFLYREKKINTKKKTTRLH